MRSTGGAARGPLPAPATRERYAGVALAVLRASIGKDWSPPGYDEGCRRLWVKFQASRTVPSGEEFEAETELLYSLLRDAGIPYGMYIGGEQGELLLCAKRHLDSACELARSLGLTSSTDSESSVWHG